MVLEDEPEPARPDIRGHGYMIAGDDIVSTRLIEYARSGVGQKGIPIQSGEC